MKLMYSNIEIGVPPCLLLMRITTAVSFLGLPQPLFLLLLAFMHTYQYLFTYEDQRFFNITAGTAEASELFYFDFILILMLN